MSVISKIATITNDDNLLSLAITLVLSTTLIGYAPSNIAMGIFVFIALIKYLKNRTKLRVDLKLLLPLLLYLFFAVSYFWSVDKDLTLKGLGRLLPFLIIPTTFSIIPRFTAKNINLILKYFTFSNIVLGILFLIVAIFNYLKTKSIGSFTYHQLVDVLELNAIYVSVFYSISYFFLLTKTNKKYTDFIGIIFLSFMIVLLSSKTIITAFVLGNLIYLVFVLGFKSLKSFKTIIVIVLVAVTIFISSSEITDRILVETTTKIEDVFKKERFNEVYPWTGTSIRLLQLRNLKDQIAEDDIFWSGFGVLLQEKT